MRMAQRNVNIGTKKLMNAMLVPDEIEQWNPLLQKLPEPGYNVLDNPFEKKTKKKKKGGKKKKK